MRLPNWICMALLVGVLADTRESPAAEVEPLRDRAAASDTVINGHRLTIDEWQQVAQRTGIRLLPGRFWYDARAGLWGREGGPTVGFAPAGQPAAKLPADASRGRTGVYFNGRELHALEVAWLKTLGPVLPGRYWLDAYGWVGYEGQPMPFVNLAATAAQRYSARTSTTRGGATIASGDGCIGIDAKSSSGIGTWGAFSC